VLLSDLSVKNQWKFTYMETYQATIGGTMNPQKSTMSVLAQIASWIPDRIIDNLTKKHKIQTRAFSANSHVMTMLYAHLAHSLSLNDICDSLH